MMNSQVNAAGLQDAFASFDPKVCAGAGPQEGDAAALCHAYGNGLRLSMAATALFFVAAAFCYYMASRHYLRDVWSKSADEMTA